MAERRPIVPHWVHEIALAQSYPEAVYVCTCQLSITLPVDLHDKDIPDHSCGWRPELVPT